MQFLAHLTGMAIIGAAIWLSPPNTGTAHANSNAAPPVQAPAQEDVTIDVDTVEQYFNGISTMQAAFTQAAPDGSIATGQFYLDRPGKLRFEYDDPIDDFIVADGKRIYFYDGQMEQVSQTDIGNTLADFLLRPSLSLEGELQVVETTRRGGLLWVSVVERANPQKGRLSLGFIEAPLSLKKWRVTDGEDRITEVELSNVQSGVQLPNKLFRFSDPRRDIQWDYN